MKKWEVNPDVLKDGEFIDPVSGVLRSKGHVEMRTKAEMKELYREVEKVESVGKGNIIRRTMNIEGVSVVEYPHRLTGSQWEIEDKKVAKKLKLLGGWKLRALEEAIKKAVA